MQAALPRLLGAAAPSGLDARDNRRKCLKVLFLFTRSRLTLYFRWMDLVTSSPFF